MKRITVEQSHQLVPYSDDLINGGIEYFTITPSPQGNGWEDVHYFTSRKTNQYSNRDGDGDSWVYILTNSTMPGYRTNNKKEFFQLDLDKARYNIKKLGKKYL